MIGPGLAAMRWNSSYLVLINMGHGALDSMRGWLASHMGVKPRNGRGSSLSFKEGQWGTPDLKQKLSPEANFGLGMVRYIYNYITLDSEARGLP